MLTLCRAPSLAGPSAFSTKTSVRWASAKVIHIVSEEPVYLQASLDVAEPSCEPSTPKSRLLELIPTAHQEKMESHFYEAVAALLQSLQEMWSRRACRPMWRSSSDLPVSRCTTLRSKL